MCLLCFKQNPFAVKDSSSLEKKLARAKEIKNLLASVPDNLCKDAEIEVEKLKEEQYLLAREI